MSFFDAPLHLAVSGSIVVLYLSTKIKRNGLPQSSPWFFPIYDWIVYFYHGCSWPKYSKARSRSLGDTSFYVGLFGLQKRLRNTLLVTDPDEQREIIAKENKLFIDKDVSESAKSILGNASLVNLSIHDHRLMRKIFGGLISPRALESFIPFTQLILTGMFESLTDTAEEVKLEAHIRDTFLSIFFQLLYGLSGEEGSTELKNDYNTLMQALFSVPNLPTYNKGVRAADNTREYLGKRFEAILAARKIERAAMKRSDKTNEEITHPPIGNSMEAIADSLIEMDMKYEGKVKESIIDNLSFFLGASHATTTTVTTTLLYRLSLPKNATSLNKLREEVASIKKLLDGPSLSFETVKAEMPYADACIHELLRMTPLSSFTPLDIPEGSELEFRGKKLQGPMGILFERSGNYLDPALFPRPNEFLPERWLDSADPKLRVTPEARRAYRPYGAGRHACLGERMAKMNLKIMLYCFASDPNRRIDFNVDKVNIVEGVFPSFEVSDEFPCMIKSG